MNALGGNIFGSSNNAASSNNTAQQSSIFGAKPTTGGGLFAGGGNPASTGGGLFGASSTAAPATSGAFGGGATTTPTNIFGSANAPTSASTTPAAPSTSIFGGTATTTPAAPTSIFGSAPTNATPAANTTAPAAAASNSLFGGSSGSFPTKPADRIATSSPKPPASSFFSQPSAATGSTPSTGGLFSLPVDTNKPAGTTPPPAPTGGIFGSGLFGKPATPSTSTPGASTVAASTPALAAGGGLFGGGMKPPDKKDNATAAMPAPPTLNLFGTKPEEKDVPAATSGQPASKAKTADVTNSTALSLAAKPSSTTPAVAVAPPSMLRGKTIEEIVNGWSADLENHVREFNKFAGEVAVWDRALIENGNTLSALYSHVLTAEREQHDIDQSLGHIEQQQKELSATLDVYEKVTQEILGAQGGSLRGFDTGPADTERDKNYMLATDLHTQLDDLSGSLAQMIDAVNALSLPFTDSGSTDDPMAQISQILSSHLESLQWIDGAVREVETRVSDVERRLKDSGQSNMALSKSRGFGLNR